MPSQKGMGMKREGYESDLSDEAWAILERHIPKAKEGGRPRRVDIREIVNAIFYLLRSGGSWRLLPHDFPNWKTVYAYFRQWRMSGEWEAMNTALRVELRMKLTREATPSVLSIDSQTVKTTEKGGFVASMAENSSRGANALRQSIAKDCS